MSWIGTPWAIRLGLPAPETPLRTTTYGVGALIAIGKEIWSRFDPSNPPEFSLDEGDTWTAIPITTNTDIATLHSEFEAGISADLGLARLKNTLFLYLTDPDPSVFLWLRWGSTEVDIIKRAYVVSYPETRTYTWTWIREVDGLVMESAPAEPSQLLNVCPLSDVVILTFPGAMPHPPKPTGDGYDVTGIRVYRSAGGVFIFVAELALDEFIAGEDGSPTVRDALPSEALNEQMPLTMEPPEGLGGIVNLPNGVIAGFHERDVYFCDPYRPYSWPEAYRMTVDFPVVGLAALDTTLVVLTEGYPYFVQGAHPDSMVMVRSPVEQACVSKHSIAAMNGAVYYASPDGLIALSPSSSANITAELFTKEQWTEWFDVAQLRGYAFDGRYHAFHPPKTHSVLYQEGDETSEVELSGFIFDPASQAFITHNLPYLGGYSDLRTDILYVVDEESLREWASGPKEPFTWRSKLFRLPHEGWFSWGHVEAFGYPIDMRFIVDGEERFTYRATSRNAFRLPVIVGRDWEFELSGVYEVIKVTLAQSAEELYES